MGPYDAASARSQAPKDAVSGEASQSQRLAGDGPRVGADGAHVQGSGDANVHTLGGSGLALKDPQLRRTPRGVVPELKAVRLAQAPDLYHPNGIVPILAPEERQVAPPPPQGSLEPQKVPEAPKPQPVSLLRICIPIVMVVAILGMVALMVFSGAQINPMMLVFPLMMGMSMLMMFAPPQGEDTNETRRTYLRHLAALREQAIKNAAAQREHETHKHPAPEDLHALVGTKRMWERTSDAPDVLAVRVGLGPTALITPINLGDPGAPEDLDPVCAVALRQVIRGVSTVEDMPVVLQLRAFRVIRCTGEHAADTVRAMICQLVVAHGPEAVGICALGAQFAWLKWLQHTRRWQQAAHTILLLDAGVDVDRALLGQGWSTIILVDSQHGSAAVSTQHSAASAPTQAGAAGNPWGAGSNPTVGEAGEQADVDPAENPQAFSRRVDGRGRVASLSEQLLREWADEEGIVLVCGEELAVVTENGKEVLGRPDRYGYGQALLLARAMTKYRRPEKVGASANDLRKLLGLKEISAQAIAQQWIPRGVGRLRVPVGLDDRGKPLQMDIKESAHGGQGPHGLCVGATGAGKSEFLRTLVVAMAATHSPEDLNFVLVDFKGGATFLGLERLPHTSAVITNLADEAVLVERMHDALAGEMHRRQEALRHAGNFLNVTAYNEARAQGENLEPMPALFVVVDEFSELLGQHPDFAELFVAIGRLGRSLQIHLLLASQRLEEGRLRGLESHLSYRIGLKTFSAAESRQVLGIPDAYQLPNKPGCGFYKTSAQAPTQFRAAYVSGALMVDEYIQQQNLKVSKWDGWGETNGQHTTRMIADPRGLTMLDAFVDAACEVGQQRGQQARQVWLPPLPSELPIGQIVRDFQQAAKAPLEPPQPGVAGQPSVAGHFLQVPLGIIDRPFEQRQDMLVADLRGQGGHMVVCGGPQTGKSTVLRSFLLGLAVTHNTDQIGMYILDLAGNSLAALGALPHVAAVAHRQEEEKVHRVIDEVLGFVAVPQKRHTILLIDGWHALTQDFETRLEDIATIAADGLAAGVHLVISTPRWSAMRPTVRDLINTRFELKLGEPLDSLICRKTQTKLPAKPGRGLTAEKEMVLFGLSSNQDVAHVATMCAELSSVPQLRMLPEQIWIDELQETSPEVIPLGVGGKELATLAWDPRTTSHLLCFGSQGSGKSTVLSTVLAGICALGREKARIVIIDHRRTHLAAVDPGMLAAYSAASSQTLEVIEQTVATLKQRMPPKDVTPQQLQQRSWWSGPEIYLCIDDLDLIADHLLHDLVELLPHSRDIGLHVVIIRKLGGATRALYQPFLAALRDQAPSVIVLDGERDDGPIFGVRPTSQPPGRGTLVQRSTTLGTIQIAQAKPPEQAEPEPVRNEGVSQEEST